MINEATITKMKQLPDSLAEEVSDFIEFLLTRHDNAQWQLWMQFTEGLKAAESDFDVYLSNLEDYENRLANGEIKW